MTVRKRDRSLEDELVDAYERGELRSVTPSGVDLAKYKEAARTTFIKDREVNIRLSSLNLMNIQGRAAEERIPYQTLIASVLHKFVSGRLIENVMPPHVTFETTRERRSAVF